MNQIKLKSNRFLSLLISLVMVFSLVGSSTTFANVYPTEDTAQIIFADLSEANEGDQEIITESPSLAAGEDQETDPDSEVQLEVDKSSVELFAVGGTPIDGDTKSFQILYTSDLHGAFSGTNYATQRAHQGLARIAAKIKELRANKEGNTILIDNGDAIQGAGTSGFIGNNNYTFPIIKGLNYLGYDAAVLGNHEFNFGIENMLLAYNGNGASNEGFKGAKITGNVFKQLGGTKDVTTDPLVEGFTPYFIKTLENGLRVAVVGMTHPSSDVWDALKLESGKYYTESATTATERAINEINSNNLADIIVAAQHLTKGNSFGREGSGVIDVLNNSTVNAENIAVFMGAHGHTRTDDNTRTQGAVNNVINGVKYIENSSNGASLGQVVVTATYNGTSGKWEVKDKSTNGVSVTAHTITTSDPEDADYLANVANEISFAESYAATKIGTLTGGNMVPAPTINGTSEAYLQPTRLVNFINEVQMYYAEADVSGACPFSTGVQHLEGDITRGSLIGIYNYDSNTVYKLKMKGWQLKQWMEWAATQYNQFDPATDLTIPHATSYLTDQFAGVNYTIDLTQPAGSRIAISTIQKNGKYSAFNPNEEYIVAANDYRTSSQLVKYNDPTGNSYGGVFKTGDELPEVLQTDCNKELEIAPDIISLMVNYIENVKGGTITNAFTPNWSFINLDWNPSLRAKVVELVNNGTISFAPGTAVTKSDIAPYIDGTVNILSFNDFHGTLDDSVSSSNPGAEKMVGKIKQIQAANPNTLVLAAGDNYQGSALSNLNYGKPVSDMLKAMQVKYSALGNHEFDWSHATIADQIATWESDGELNFLCANIFEKGTNNIPEYLNPYAIETIDGIKIGIIGLITTDTPSLVKASNVEPYTFGDPVEAADKYVKILKNDENCDVVIVLAHMGSNQAALGVSEVTGEAVPLAKVPGVDAVISGHTHRMVNGTVAGTTLNGSPALVPVVQGNYNGRGLAQLSILKELDGSFSVLGNYINLQTQKATLPVDTNIKNIVDSANAALAPLLNQVIGNYTGTKLETQTEVGVWANQIMYDYLLRTTGEARVVITNQGGWRSGAVPRDVGSITMNYMYTLMPFDNTIVTLEMTGAQLIKMLNQQAYLPTSDKLTSAALYYGAVKDGSTYTLLDTGEVIENSATKKYKVTATDFILTGGDYFDFITGCSNAKDTGVPLRESMVDELTYQMNNAQTPRITTNLPATLSVANGKSVTLSVAARISDDGTLTYQWYKDGTEIASATESSYTVSNAKSSSAGSYTVVVTNTKSSLKSSITSAICILSVSAASSSSGSSSTRSTNSSSTPSTSAPASTPAPAAEATEDMPVTITTIPGTNAPQIELQSQANKATGSVNAEIESKYIMDVIQQVRDNSTNEQLIKIVAGVPSDISVDELKTITVSIGEEAADSIANDTDAIVIIQTPIGAVTFDDKAIETIVNDGNEGALRLIITNVNSQVFSAAGKLSQNNMNKIGERPIYEFGVYKGNVKISNFKGGKATVNIPYYLRAGENENAIIVYYSDGNGNLSTMRGSYKAALNEVNFVTKHFSTYAIAYNPVYFNDVSNQWFADPVMFIAARDITSGVGNDNYSPQGVMTRGQFITLLLRAYQIDPMTGDNFADAGNTWYTGYLAAAKQMGISMGVGNNNFAPEREINREEMFTLLYNTLKVIDELPDGTGRSISNFSDSTMVSSWALEAVQYLVEKDIVSGSDNRLDVKNNSTRAQMAQLLYNLLK